MPCLGRVSSPGSETYQYYDLPFCSLDVNYKAEDLGEVIEGDRLATTMYDLSFRVDKELETLCNKRLSKEDLAKFRKAVKEDYYFQVSSAAQCIARS